MATIGGKDLNDKLTLDLIDDTILKYQDDPERAIDNLYRKIREAHKHKSNLPCYNTPESKMAHKKIDDEIKGYENEIIKIRQGYGMDKKKINEANYSVSIQGLETDDANTLAEILQLTSQLDNESDALSNIEFPSDLEIGVIDNTVPETPTPIDNSLSLDESDEYEDEIIPCAWCGEEMPKDCMVKEKDLGYICNSCRRGIESRGEKLSIEESVKPTENEAWGYHGALLNMVQEDVIKDAEKVWNETFSAFEEEGLDDDFIQKFLDSPFGRHLADDLYSDIKNNNVSNAIHEKINYISRFYMDRFIPIYDYMKKESEEETIVDEAVKGSKCYYTIYKGVPEKIIETGYATEEDAYHKFEEIANEYNASSESEDEFEDGNWKSYVRICPDEDGLTLDINTNDIEEDEFEDTDEMLVEKVSKSSDSYEEMIQALEKQIRKEQKNNK